MILGWHPVAQALLGTLLTWGLTAVGSGLVFFVPPSLSPTRQRLVLDIFLGFAAGVMLAASYWSLLAPAIESAESSGTYGNHAYIPVAIGIVLGAVFVAVADKLLPEHADDPLHALSGSSASSSSSTNHEPSSPPLVPMTPRRSGAGTARGKNTSITYRKGKETHPDHLEAHMRPMDDDDEEFVKKRASVERARSWRRIVMLVIAITIHNFPEGLAVGVGFGALSKHSQSDSPEAIATFDQARTLAWGIGLQNFPEGLAVSLPLMRCGFDKWQAFMYGQLSGMVEPLGGVLGAVAISVAMPLLPYALSFAAGAMIYVVVDDLIPEAHTSGNRQFASVGVIIGFIVMMAMDVGLG